MPAPIDPTTTIGSAIRRYRLRRRLDQTQLAGAVGVSQGTVSDWETGRQSPPVGKLAMLAKVLGVKPGKLLEE